MRRPLRLLSLAALLPALGGCPPPAAAPAPGGGAAEASPALASSLQVEAAADSVRFLLQVTNAGPAPLALEFGSGQRAEFTVLDQGREVWRWSAGHVFTQALATETLAPGETRTWSEVWRPAPALRGRPLVAVGELLAGRGRVRRESPFVVP